MDRYIYLDNWVYSLISHENIRRELVSFIKANNYVVVASSILFTELYDPRPAQNEKGRMYATANFLGQVPCVIADPVAIWADEIKRHLSPLESIPATLDLRGFPTDIREKAILLFLSRDKNFLDQGKDILEWSKGYKAIKEDWLETVRFIIDDACQKGNLKKNAKGRFVSLSQHKEIFLFSLDLRMVYVGDLEKVIQNRKSRLANRERTITSIRINSLCFWYFYVDVLESNKPKISGSDIGDIYQSTFLPYCAAFTADRAMSKILARIRGNDYNDMCEIITRDQLDKYLGNIISKSSVIGSGNL